MQYRGKELNPKESVDGLLLLRQKDGLKKVRVTDVIIASLLTLTFLSMVIINVRIAK